MNPDFEKEVEKNRTKLEAYEGLCKELGEEPGVVALAWQLHNPVVTAPIIGPRTVEQLESAIRATEVTLDAATLRAWTRSSPAPAAKRPRRTPGRNPPSRGIVHRAACPSGCPVGLCVDA